MGLHLLRILTQTTTKHKLDAASVFGRSPISVAQLFFRSKSTARPVEGSYLSLNSDDEHDDLQSLDFPGGKVTFMSQMKFIPEASGDRVPCYRVLDDHGCLIFGSRFHQVEKEKAVKMYRDMVTLEIMDTIFYEVQRQGRISFYLTSIGEEAVSIGSAAALSPDDVIFPQYREPGVLLWRGFSLQEFSNQLFGNKDDYGKGRQMPIHYGSRQLNYVTISSPIATQLPQAVGAAYSLKMDNKDACTVAYMGDGCTSEGDFHAALNFAAVLEAPVLFICRNNGWAISTHVSEQFRSDGIVVKGKAYGIRSIRVDGNDALAVYSAIKEAREMVVGEQKPVLVEVMTYRVSHHSTSDDSTKYRQTDEIAHWNKTRNPVARFRKWIEKNDWWDNDNESHIRDNIRNQLMETIREAGKMKKPEVEALFTDVYDDLPPNLREQEKSVKEAIKNHPRDYPNDVPVYSS